LALNGQNLIKIHNNLPAIDDPDSVDMKEVMRGGKREWRGAFLSLRATL
jgi:hypothetical protein